MKSDDELVAARLRARATAEAERIAKESEQAQKTVLQKEERAKKAERIESLAQGILIWLKKNRVNYSFQKLLRRGWLIGEVATEVSSQRDGETHTQNVPVYINPNGKITTISGGAVDVSAIVYESMHDAIAQHIEGTSLTWP